MTNHPFFSSHTGKARTKVSYLHDGALVVEYPFHMAITMETNPHPLLSTEHQLYVKRKVILPDGLVHRLEWRYYLKHNRATAANQRTLSRIGRRMRVSDNAAAAAARSSGSSSGSRSRSHGPTTPLHAAYVEPVDSVAEGYNGKALWVCDTVLFAFLLTMSNQE